MAELQKRFEEMDRARKLLVSFSAVFSAGVTATTRKRGGTSAYAREKSSLIQKIRHAVDRKDDPKTIAKMKKELAVLDTQYKKARE